MYQTEKRLENSTPVHSSIQIKFIGAYVKFTGAYVKFTGAYVKVTGAQQNP